MVYRALSGSCFKYVCVSRLRDPMVPLYNCVIEDKLQGLNFYVYM